MTFKFLGTGTSVGVPVIGCACPVCTSPDPRNNRTRCSAHLKIGDLDLLIDAGPDLRQQALRENLTKIDAVLYTHNHLDHVAGFDELRAFCWHRDEPLPLYANPECLRDLERMFPWAFSNENTYHGYIKPDPQPITAPFTLGQTEPVTVTPLPVIHAADHTNGYRIDTPQGQSLAYISDVKTIPESTLALMENLDVLIIDALRYEEHPTHMSVEQALAASAQVGSPQTYLTHCTHDIDYHTLSQILAETSPHVTLSYDGLTFEI